MSHTRSLLAYASKWVKGQGRTERALRNSVASGTDFVARLVVGLVVNPILVGSLGGTVFGLWQVLRQLVDYAGPASGRPAQALKWTIANEQSSADLDAKRRHVGSTLLIWLGFLPILTSAGALLVWMGPSWLDTPAELVGTVSLATGLLMANIVVTTLVDVPRAVLTGENLAYKILSITAGQVILGGALTVAALKIGAGLPGVAACPVITSALTGVLILGVARRNVRWFGVAWPGLAAVRSFLRLSGWFFVWRLIMQVMRSSDLVVLGAFGSVELVTVYVLTKYVPQTLTTALSMIISGITPGLGGMIGARHVAQARAVRGEMLAVMWLLCASIAPVMLIWNPAFVALWVGPTNFAGHSSMLLIVAMAIQFVFIRGDANIIDLTLDLKAKVLLGAFSAGVSVTLSAVLVSRMDMGIVGLCAGLIVGRTFLSVGYPIMVGRILGLSVRAQVLGALRPLLVGGVLLIIANAVGQAISVDRWLVLVAGATATCPVVIVVAFFTGLTAKQRSALYRRLQR